MVTPMAVGIAFGESEIDASNLVDAVARLARDGVGHAVVRSSYGATIAEFGIYPVALSQTRGSPEELRDAIVDDLLGREGVHPTGYSPDTVYTTGDCDVFAVALRTILDGLGWVSDLHAVFDPYDEKGRRTRNPYLIHCGVRVCMPGDDGIMANHVIDVQGVTPEDVWNTRWAENGSCSEPVVDTVTRKRLERAQQEDIAIDRLSDAMPYAAIAIAATLGLRPAQALRAA